MPQGEDTPSAPASASGAGAKTRSANRIDHQNIIEELYGGDQHSYNHVLQQDAEDASALAKAHIGHIEARCSSYQNAGRIASTWVSQLEQDLQKLNDLTTSYSAAINACVSYDLAFKGGKNVDSYKQKLQATRSESVRCGKLLTETLALCESALSEYHATREQRPARRGRLMAEDDDDDVTSAVDRKGQLKAQVKPDKLTVNATPDQLEQWIDIFKVYCEFSNLLTASYFSQQQICFSFLDGTLRGYLKGKVNATTPLFGHDCHAMEAAVAEPGSVISYLYAKFQSTHPLESRRSTLFGLRQQRNQLWSVFYAKWDAAYRNADLDRYLVGEVIQVGLLISHTLDGELVDLFQELKNPTREDLVAVAVKYEANHSAKKNMLCSSEESASANRTDSNGQPRQQQYRGGNKDNYVRDHFKKLEAEGKCVKCAMPVKPQDLEEHKNSSCKAKGAKCTYCVSKGMGARAKGHLEAACAKKLHAKVRRVAADADDGEGGATVRTLGASSSEDEYDDDAVVHRIDVEAEDDDWTPLPGFYSYTATAETELGDDDAPPPLTDCEDEESDEEEESYSYSGDDSSLTSESDEDDDDEGWEFDEYWNNDDHSLGSDGDYEEDNLSDNSVHEAQSHTPHANAPLSRSARRRRRRWNAVSRARAALAASEAGEHAAPEPAPLPAQRYVRLASALNEVCNEIPVNILDNEPLVNALDDVRKVPKNVPVPLFDIQFRQHEKRGPWHSVSAIADTGANRTIFSSNLLERAGIDINTKGKEKIRLADTNASMPSSGHTFLRIKATGDSKKDYVVANVLVSPTLKEDALISYNDLRRLRVIDEDFPRRHHHNNNNNIEPLIYRTHVDKLNDIADKYPDVFDSEKLAPLKVPPMEININRQHPDYKPLRIYTARKTPLHFEDNADELLKYLLETGVIKRADPNRHYEWVSPAFFVPKRSGKARLVIDFSRLSKFAERTPHPFPSPRDIIRSIKPSSRWFLTSDMRNGYFQLRLSEEATNYTAFLLPQGLFVMCRGPQGLSPTSDNFVAATDHILEGLDLVKIIDDTLIQGETPDECLEKFEQLCERARQYGLTLTREKLMLAQEVTFAGWVIGKDGIKSDPYKLAALSEFPTPKNLRDLRSFCGAITQLNMLSPDIAHAMAGLRPLLKSKNHFEWTSYHDAEFKKVRSLVTEEMKVKPFNKDLPTRIYVDASRLYGMGYALCNVELDTVKDDNGEDKTVERLRIIQCNSRALQPAETRYATNELECGALVWSIIDSRHYVLGLNGFDVYTDHRALEAIFKQPLADVVNARMLRMRHKVSDYVFTVKWQSGAKMHLADALSRNPLFAPPEDDDSDDSAMINLVAADPALQEMYDAAERDDDYKSLLEAIKSGAQLKNLPDNHYAKKFFSVYDNLSIMQSLLVLNDSRIVVPKSMREAIIRQIHSAHTGIPRCLSKARAEFFWPQMSEDITNAVLTCEPCQKYRPSQPEEEVLNLPPTTEPMQLVGSDLFSLAGEQHVILADAFSGMIFVKRLKRETSTAVIKALISFFRLIGMPQHLLSDGGPCYASDEFTDFCLTYHIKHLRSSPGHPRSNGLSESHVSSAKYLLRKCDTFEEFEAKLLDLMTMPRSGESESPSEKFFGRKLRTQLPRLANFYDPTEGNAVAPAFAVGDRVRLQNIRTQLWDARGTVIGIRPIGRSFDVAVDGGGVLVRNRRFMKRLTEAKSDVLSDSRPQSPSTTGDEKSHVAAPLPPPRTSSPKKDSAQLPPRRSKRLAERASRGANRARL